MQANPKSIVVEPAREVEVIRETDVLVVGGGMAGCSAAISAARGGARTLLVERYGFLGGTATAAMVGCFCGVYTCGPDSTQQQLIYGNLVDIMQSLRAWDAGAQIRHRYHVSIPALILVLDHLLAESGAEMLFHTQFVAPIIEDSHIKGIIVENKQGRQAILAKVVIDTSGDGDVAARSGVPYELGDELGRLQAPTYVFYLAGVDCDRAMSVPEVELKKLQMKAIEEGEFSFSRVSGSYSPGNKPGVVHVNMTHVHGVNGIDPESLSKGHIDGRKQVEDYFLFLRRHVPGFENACLDAVAPQLGIRETRRIMGEYVLTREDILGARKFEDAVCRSSWPIEDHTVGLDTVRLHLPGDDYYNIPYRVLLPLRVENLLIAGRCVSTTHDALASLRVMGPGIAMGQAAGAAAGLSIQRSISPRLLPFKKLQEQLLLEKVLI